MLMQTEWTKLLHIVQCNFRPDGHTSNLRIAAYETLMELIKNSPKVRLGLHFTYNFFINLGNGKQYTRLCTVPFFLCVCAFYNFFNICLLFVIVIKYMLVWRTATWRSNKQHWPSSRSFNSCWTWKVSCRASMNAHSSEICSHFFVPLYRFACIAVTFL